MKAAIVGMVLAGAVLASLPAVTEATDREARFDPKAVVARLERTLARQRLEGQPVQIEYSTPYMPEARNDGAVDAQIRRMGELIRRAERESR